MGCSPTLPVPLFALPATLSIRLLALRTACRGMPYLDLLCLLLLRAPARHAGINIHGCSPVLPLAAAVAAAVWACRVASPHARRPRPLRYWVIAASR